MDPTREWPAAQLRVVELVRDLDEDALARTVPRSEERRVGKECLL